MERKKKNNLWWYVFLIFFVMFLGYYIAIESGYYETKQGQKTNLTQEKIKEFEADVKNGKQVDIKNYLEETETDRSNKVSNLGLKISETSESIITSGIESFFKVMIRLFSN